MLTCHQSVARLLSQTASFFLTYVTLSALWTSPFSGLRIIGLLIYWIKSKIAATEKARARLWQEQTAKYGSAVSPLAHPCTVASKGYMRLRTLGVLGSWHDQQHLHASQQASGM